MCGNKKNVRPQPTNRDSRLEVARSEKSNGFAETHTQAALVELSMERV